MVNSFEREYDLENEIGTIMLSQLEEGDVNCVVWDAALVLSKYLEARSSREPGWLRSKRVVELGAGLGCVGLVAACYGADVTLTDQPKAVPLLDHNVKRNMNLVESLKGSIQTKGLDWCEGSEETPCDILLLADCVYYSESIRPLVKTMQQLSTETTEILLSQEDRSYSQIQSAAWTEFRQELEPLFTVTSVPRGEQHEEFCSPDIMLLRLTKKRNSTE